MTASAQQASLLNSILTTYKGSPHQPKCRVCQDLGVVYFANPAAHQGRSSGSWELCECQERISKCDGRPPFQYFDTDRGCLVPCPSARARRKLNRIRHYSAASEIPLRYQGKFLDSIEPNPVHTDLMRALEESIELIAHFQNRDSVKGLYLYGPVGCGKTLLSCAILNEILRIYAVPVRYAKISRDILGKLQASFNPSSEIYGEGKKIERELATIDTLVIDDFGIQRNTEWVHEVLYDLIDARYENNLLTIFTSNEPMSSWKGISGGRVLSRLREMCREMAIQMPDYREKVHADIQQQNLRPWGA